MDRVADRAYAAIRGRVCRNRWFAAAGGLAVVLVAVPVIFALGEVSPTGSRVATGGFGMSFACFETAYNKLN